MTAPRDPGTAVISKGGYTVHAKPQPRDPGAGKVPKAPQPSK